MFNLKACPLPAYSCYPMKNTQHFHFHNKNQKNNNNNYIGSGCLFIIYKLAYYCFNSLCYVQDFNLRYNTFYSVYKLRIYIITSNQILLIWGIDHILTIFGCSDGGLICRAGLIAIRSKKKFLGTRIPHTLIDSSLRHLFTSMMSPVSVTWRQLQRTIAYIIIINENK